MKLVFGFSTPKNKYLPIVSWIIKCMERVPFSHMYVRWHSSTGVECFYHAATGMVHFLGGEIARERLNLVEEYEVEITKEDYRKIIAYTHKNAGKKYAFKQLIGMGLQRVFGWRKNPLADGRKSSVCTEEMGYILELLGFHIPADLEVKGLRYMREWCQANLIKVEKSND